MLLALCVCVCVLIANLCVLYSIHTHHIPHSTLKSCSACLSRSCCSLILFTHISSSAHLLLELSSSTLRYSVPCLRAIPSSNSFSFSSNSHFSCCSRLVSLPL